MMNRDKEKRMRNTFFIIFGLLLSSFVTYATTLPPTVELGAPIPAGWRGYNITANYTANDTSPDMLNFTRGFIYELNVSASQQTHRWIGYVGNISGSIRLGDGDDNNLYEWNNVITSGEVYATRYHGTQITNPLAPQRDTGVNNIPAYDYVDWTRIICVNQTTILNESAKLDHNLTVDNDGINRTFLNTSAFHAAAMDFHVAATLIDVSASNCYGTYLSNGTTGNDQFWQMVLLEDGDFDGVNGDIIYSSLVENNGPGFNGKTYDFQIILPQYGQVLNPGNAQGDVKSNIAYYFYLELIGEGWPSQNP